MKRKKDSIYPTRASQRCNKAKGKVDDDDDETQNHQLCPYFANFPSHIVVQILLQLPIKSLLICKCVCKMWKTLISEPHFAKLHFQKTPVSLMIRTNDSKRVSRTLYLLDSEPEIFEIGSNNHIKLAPIFKLPLRDAKSFREKIMNKPKRPLRAARLDLEKNDKNSQMLNIDFKPYYDKFGVVNSCNGLLCLCCPFEGNPLVICNPVTGEFMRLPKATNTPNRLHNLEPVGFGFGFQPKTNEYKVLQMWKKFVGHAYRHRKVFERMILEINTLGTPSWKNVEVDPQVSNSRLKYPTCLNGVIHWIRFEGQNRSILCFCLESERLQSFPSPPNVFRNHNRSSRNEHISMRESRGLLSICDTSSFDDVTMWVMNEYGIGESWTKVYNIDTSISSLGRPDKHYGLCWPLKHFEDGASMLLYHSCNCLIYYEPEKYGCKVFRIHGTDSESFQIFPHTPSLISLKDAVKGDNIEVLSIYSMCANVKLREENEVLSLSQQLV